MFGPAPAIGLVELVAELKLMPEVEVSTYLHQSWPALVEDINRQAPGTHTMVIGYSLGANSSVFVANNAKYVDLIIALQPSMLSWNPPVTGKVGRVIEIYNPNPSMTLGGMGSKKLIGDNIEYITNYDSHLGAQFNSEFRNLVRSEIAKFTADDRSETAHAAALRPNKLAQLPPSPNLKQEKPTHPQRDLPAKEPLQIAQAKAPKLQKPAQSEQLVDERQKQKQELFLDSLSGSVNSGDVFVQRRLTTRDLKDYAERTFRNSNAGNLMAVASD